MKNNSIRIIFFIVLSFLLSSSSDSQANMSTLEMTIKSDKEAYAPGECINLEITVENKSKKSVSILFLETLNVTLEMATIGNIPCKTCWNGQTCDVSYKINAESCPIIKPHGKLIQNTQYCISDETRGECKGLHIPNHCTTGILLEQGSDRYKLWMRMEKEPWPSWASLIMNSQGNELKLQLSKHEKKLRENIFIPAGIKSNDIVITIKEDNIIGCKSKPKPYLDNGSK